MNNTQKRQLNIRNKLMAAIAMLLVSSIMMVSTTYAWFTLSTAPEVQGITTTVGANGNLEIALSPITGNAGDINSAMGDSNLAWTAKNLTWGNLLNLEDASYALDQITLLPARLNLAGTNQNDSTLNTNPLSTPVYGADGRLQSLASNTAVGAKYEAGENGQPVEAEEYMVNSYKGVRAIGTSSTMTPQQLTFSNSLSKLTTAMSNAQSNVKSSLTVNGAALAEMAIQHANVDGTDSNDYSEFKGNLEDVVTKLETANDQLEIAIKAALLAAASSSASDQTTYDAAVLAITDDAALENIWDEVSGSASSVSSITNAYNSWVEIGGKLADAREELDKLGDSGILWSDISTIMNNLMNTAGVKLNNKTLSEMTPLLQDYLTDNPSDESINFVTQLMTGAEVQLGPGSGVYADFGEVTGKVSAPITIGQIRYGTKVNLHNVPATIMTTTTPATGCYLEQINLGLATLGAMSGGTASNVIDVAYGYMVDFFFRTNASGSNLLLQTAAAQRVYTDSESTETLGHGSTMTFRTGSIDREALEGLMECVRVVFLNTETNEVYGIAKLELSEASSEEVTAATEGVAATYDITAPLYLHQYTVANGVITFGEKLTGTNAVLTGLDTNTAMAVSAMVYLDGDNVTNEDVANAETSTTGTLNLQFASSAPLVPMENTALKNMAAEEEEEEVTYNVDTTTNVSNATVIGAFSDGAYGFTVTPADGYTVTSVSYKMGDATEATPLEAIEGAYAIPNVSGDLVIYVVTTASGS